MFRFVRLRLAASALSRSRHETLKKKKKTTTKEKKKTREEDISRVRAGRKRRKPSRRDGPPRRNRPTVPCYYLRSRGESAFLPSFLSNALLPSSVTILSLSFAIVIFGFFHPHSFLLPSHIFLHFPTSSRENRHLFSRLRIDTVKPLNFGVFLSKCWRPS